MNKVRKHGLWWLFGNLCIPIIPVVSSMIFRFIERDGAINPTEYLSDALIILFSLSYSLLTLCFSKKSLAEDNKLAWIICMAGFLVLFSFGFYGYVKGNNKISPKYMFVILIIVVALMYICSKCGSKLSDETAEAEKRKHQEMVCNCSRLLRLVSNEEYKDIFWKKDIMYCEPNNFKDIESVIESKKNKGTQEDLSNE